MFKHNFHTHTSYCDGSSNPEEYVLAALNAGLESIGFSGHSPVPFENNFAIRDSESLAEYCSEINTLKKKYQGKINVYLALEADFIPGVTLDFKHFFDEYKLDYIIGSVHLVINERKFLWFIDGPYRDRWKKGLELEFSGDIRKAVGAYYGQINQMIESQQFDVIGHLDKIKMHNQDEYFRETDAWYIKLFMETLELAKARNCIIEVNTRGLYKKRSNALFPGEMILEEMHKMNIPVTINSDAHKPEEVGLLLNEAAEVLLNTAYREVYIFSSGGWKSIPLV